MMREKKCKNCVKNDAGICDRYGIQVKDEDHCEKHRFNWKEKLLQRFMNDSRR